MSGISEYKFCQFKLFQWTTLCIRVVFYSRSKCPWNSFHSLKPCQCSFFFKPSDKSTFNIMLSCLDFLSLLQVMKIMAKCWYFRSNWRDTCTKNPTVKLLRIHGTLRIILSVLICTFITLFAYTQSNHDSIVIY